MSDSDRADMPPRAPYFLRAMHAWLTDAGLTPQIIVDTRAGGVHVPEGYSDEHGRIVLNVAHEAVRNLELANGAVSFNARFSGVAHTLYLPMTAILGIYARETGEGMVFNEEPEQAGRNADAPAGNEGRDEPDGNEDGDKKKPSLRIVK